MVVNKDSENVRDSASPTGAPSDDQSNFDGKDSSSVDPKKAAKMKLMRLRAMNAKKKKQAK